MSDFRLQNANGEVPRTRTSCSGYLCTDSTGFICTLLLFLPSFMQKSAHCSRCIQFRELQNSFSTCPNALNRIDVFIAGSL